MKYAIGFVVIAGLIVAGVIWGYQDETRWERWCHSQHGRVETNLGHTFCINNAGVVLGVK